MQKGEKNDENTMNDLLAGRRQRLLEDDFSSLTNMKSAFEYTLRVWEDSVIVTTGVTLDSVKKGLGIQILFLGRSNFSDPGKRTKNFAQLWSSVHGGPLTLRPCISLRTS